jgi:glycosyltransferase involved in cell wall biosynthesis
MRRLEPRRQILGAMQASDHSFKPDLAAENLMPTGSSARLRVCLITTEFHGLFKNGGIGTANTGLALAFARAGFDVTVAYANSDENGPRLAEGDFGDLQTTYRQLGITLDFVPASRLIAKPFDDPRSASYCVYLYLKQHAFDVVYFNDCGGHGYYSLLAKRVGVFPKPPRMYVVAHGPQEWVMEINSLPYRDRWPVVTAHMERRSAVLADALISPSQYLVDWMISHGWEMPAKVLVIPNIVTLPEDLPRGVPGANFAAITEIVFFGRLEVRKGLELFCDAIDLLEQVNHANVRITFLGKFALVAGLHSGIYVVERARQWRFHLRILSTYSQEEALAYLRKPGVLAVIPSLAENSPCVVGECLGLSIPFVATDSGGTAELVTPEDRGFCLIAPDRRELAAKLEAILESGQRSGRPAISATQTLANWMQLSLSGVAEGAEEGLSRASALPLDTGLEPVTDQPVTDPPLVSVCLASSSVPASMESLLESLILQNYPRLEIILVEDGVGGERHHPSQATLELVRDRISWRVVPETFCDRSAARNRAVAEANGEYLLFIEEDMVVLMPDCVHALVTAALRTDAHIITGVPLQVWDAGRLAAQRDGFLGYFPIGSCTELGAFENCFGKGAFLVKRQDFRRLGGFETPCEGAIEDWLFLASSVLAGLRLEVLPEPLFRYKMIRPVELNRSNVVDNYRRILAAYSGQRIQSLTHMIESIADIDRANQERLQQVLARLGADVREIALRVSTFLEPNHPDALRGVVQFCLERHKIDEAFDFAFHNGRHLLSDALASATLLAEDLALDAVHRPALELWQDVDLTDEVKRKVQSASSLPAEEPVQPLQGVAQSIQTGMTILRARAVCPPETRSVRAVVSVNVGEPRSVSLAVVVAPPGSRLRVSEKDLTSDDAYWWSGWVSADKTDGKFEVFVSVSEPTEALLDLHFLCHAQDNSAADGSLVWTDVTASISVNGTISRSIIEPSELTAPIPREMLDTGILLTENSEFSFPIFVPGNPTLVHPLPGKIVLVRFPDVVPPRAKGVRSVVSLERAEAHPVQFGVWVRSSSVPVASASDFTAADAFSGWFTVRDKFRRHRFTVSLRERASESMDLYLATRVVEYPDVYYCHAVWHELLILE